MSLTYSITDTILSLDSANFKNLSAPGAERLRYHVPLARAAEPLRNAVGKPPSLRRLELLAMGCVRVLVVGDEETAVSSGLRAYGRGQNLSAAVVRAHLRREAAGVKQSTARRTRFPRRRNGPTRRGWTWCCRCCGRRSQPRPWRGATESRIPPSTGGGRVRGWPSVRKARPPRAAAGGGRRVRAGL